MASGKSHDQAITFLTLPIVLITVTFFGRDNAISLGLSFLLGGLWLSPDLDTNSIALKRWGIFRFIWWPYRKAINHRSCFSHGPIIGSSIRIIYLVIISYLAFYFLNGFGLVNINRVNMLISHLFKEHKSIIISTSIGLELSSWIHLVQDGDPLPIEWSKLIKNKK